LLSHLLRRILVVALNRSGRLTFGAIALSFALVVSLLVSVAWKVASRPVADTEGLISQFNMLVGTFQVVLTLVATLATVHLAMRTADMADASTSALVLDAQRDADAAVGSLVEEALGAATCAGVLATLMRPSWRWHLPGRRRPREHLMMSTTQQLWGHLSGAVRWSEEVSYRQARLREPADEVVDCALAVHEAALLGDVSAAEAGTRRLRSATDELRNLTRPTANG
jgi:hypothetical protein